MSGKDDQLVWQTEMEACVDDLGMGFVDDGEQQGEDWLDSSGKFGDKDYNSAGSEARRQM